MFLLPLAEAAFLLCPCSSDPQPAAADMQGFYFCRISEQHRTDIATLKHPVKFRIKYSMLTPDRISLNFINKPSLCAEPCLQSADQRFLEVVVTFDFVITAKSHSIVTLAVQLCGAVKCSLDTAGGC